MALAPDGKLLAFRQMIAGRGGLPVLGDRRPTGPLRLWDLDAGKDRGQLDGPRPDADSEHMLFSPDSRLLATCGPDGVVHVWDLASGKEVRHFAGHDGRVMVLAFSPDGRRLASGGWDTTILVWDLGR